MIDLVLTLMNALTMTVVYLCVVAFSLFCMAFIILGANPGDVCNKSWQYVTWGAIGFPLFLVVFFCVVVDSVLKVINIWASVL